MLEAADREIQEGLGHPEQSDTMIWQQQTPEEGGHVGMGATPPPPPPLPSAEERMWAEVRERSALHGIDMPPERQLSPLQLRAKMLIEAGRATDESGFGLRSRGCGCIALVIFLMLMTVIRAIISIMD